MAITKHVFVSAGGAMLPEWTRAFPRAQNHAAGSGAPLPPADVVWLAAPSKVTAAALPDPFAAAKVQVPA